MPPITRRLRGSVASLIDDLQHPGIAIAEGQSVIQTLLNGIVRRIETASFQNSPLIVVREIYFHSITLLF